MTDALKKFVTLDEALADPEHAGQLYLDLKDQKTIPASIGQLKRLTWLFLASSSNHPHEIPDEVVALPELRFLHVAGAYERFPTELLAMKHLVELEIGYPSTLSELPDELVALENLEVLNLGGLRKLAAFPEVVTRLSKLRRLDLGGTQLPLPESLARLERLEVLKLGSLADAPQFPAVLLELKNLRELNVEGGTREIPDRIDRLSQLEVLWLPFGGIPAIPKALARLAKLRVLYLFRNRLTTLPPELGELPALEELTVGDNQIRELPPAIGKLTKLTKLDVKANPLQRLPPEIGALRALKTLDVDGTALRSVPDELCQLANLDVLHAKRTQLEALPASFGQLAKLRCCWLDDTPLCSLPDSFGGLAQLEVLGLSNTKVKEVAAVIATCAKLNVLSMTGVTVSAEEASKLDASIAARVATGKYVTFDKPRIAAAKRPPPTSADPTPLSPVVVAEIARLGGTLVTRATPPAPLVETLVDGDYPLPESIRQWHQDITWPPDAVFRGIIMESWRSQSLLLSRWVDLGEYECGHHAPYYPLAVDEYSQIFYLCSLADDNIADPYVYRLDHESFEEHHPLSTGRRLSVILSKLRGGADS